MPQHVVTLRRWQVVAAFAAVTASFVVGLIVVVHFNNQRIGDIQRSRVESCERTYEGIRQVFLPFFPPKAHRSYAQQRDLDKFNGTVDRLKSGCRQQTKF